MGRWNAHGGQGQSQLPIREIGMDIMVTLIRVAVTIVVVIAFAIYIGCFIAYGDGDDEA